MPADIECLGEIVYSLLKDKTLYENGAQIVMQRPEGAVERNKIVRVLLEILYGDESGGEKRTLLERTIFENGVFWRKNEEENKKGNKTIHYLLKLSDLGEVSTYLDKIIFLLMECADVLEIFKKKHEEYMTVYEGINGIQLVYGDESSEVSTDEDKIVSFEEIRAYNNWKYSDEYDDKNDVIEWVSDYIELEKERLKLCLIEYKCGALRYRLSEAKLKLKKVNYYELLKDFDDYCWMGARPKLAINITGFYVGPNTSVLEICKTRKLKNESEEKYEITANHSKGDDLKIEEITDFDGSEEFNESGELFKEKLPYADELPDAEHEIEDHKFGDTIREYKLGDEWGTYKIVDYRRLLLASSIGIDRNCEYRLIEGSARDVGEIIMDDGMHYKRTTERRATNVAMGLYKHGLIGGEEYGRFLTLYIRQIEHSRVDALRNQITRLFVEKRLLFDAEINDTYTDVLYSIWNSKALALVSELTENIDDKTKSSLCRTLKRFSEYREVSLERILSDSIESFAKSDFNNMINNGILRPRVNALVDDVSYRVQRERNTVEDEEHEKNK